jgi:hypothetical protein
MAEAKKIEPEKIVIREFRLVKGQIESPFDFKISNIKLFDFKVDFNTGFNLEEGLIKADFVIEVASVSLEPTQEATCVYHFVFLFYVTDLKEHAQIAADETIDWNPYLANAIASITYSTSRGILISRFQGTVMKDFILPVVDPNSLLQNKVSQQVAFNN